MWRNNNYGVDGMAITAMVNGRQLGRGLRVVLGDSSDDGRVPANFAVV